MLRHLVFKFNLNSNLDSNSSMQVISFRYLLSNSVLPLLRIQRIHIYPDINYTHTHKMSYTTRNNVQIIQSISYYVIVFRKLRRCSTTVV